MQMTREGKETTEIRTFIDEKYSQYGPSTETGVIPANYFNMAGPTLSDSTESLPADTREEGPIGLCGQATSSCQGINK